MLPGCWRVERDADPVRSRLAQPHVQNAPAEAAIRGMASLPGTRQTAASRHLPHVTDSLLPRLGLTFQPPAHTLQTAVAWEDLARATLLLWGNA